MNLYLNPLSYEQSPLPLQNETTVLGTDPQCTHILRDEKIAARHARIDQKENQLILRDLQSPTGTFLNETKVREAELQIGDVLRIGNCEFQVCSSDAAQSSTMTSRNPVLHKEFQIISSVAKLNYPVLLLGPSGSGKDVVAQEIHRCSPRGSGPFISVNCSTLTEALVESELFGHIKGSFTGAVSDRKGAFESARGGTLFLDEIGDLPFSMQAKLLRALENDEIRPVGSDQVLKTNVRIIAATHQNLQEKIQTGQFRSDLFFRLNVIQMALPGLSHRMEDFEDLLMHFAKAHKVRFSMPAIYRLKKYTWPGNIRELKNVVTRAKALFPQEYISAEHVDSLLDQPRADSVYQNGISTQMASSLPVLKEIERQMILKRLNANRGNQRRTAQDLGIPKSTLHDRLKYYSIDVKNYKF